MDSGQKKQKNSMNTAWGNLNHNPELVKPVKTDKRLAVYAYRLSTNHIVWNVLTALVFKLVLSTDFNF